MAFSGTGLLVFIDDVTEDRSSQKNSYTLVQIQSNGAKLIHIYSTNGDDPKHSKSNPGVF